MSAKNGGATHSVMNKKLAEALMEAGVQHFAIGGDVGMASGATAPVTNTGQFFNAVASPMKDLVGAFTFNNNYQAGLAPQMQSDYSNMINQGGANAMAGYGQSQDILSQQQNLAQQLLAQTQGSGPNPAQAMLQQQTGNNMAQQAALMASARGASVNPALIARQAAQQGAGIQQQGAGQAAILGAQQQLQAQQQLAAQQQAMQQANLGQQQLQGNLFTGAGALQNTQNANNVSNYGQMQGINAQVAQGNANRSNQAMGGLLNGAMSAIGGFAEGGQVAPMNIPRLDDAVGISLDKPSFGGGGDSSPKATGLGGGSGGGGPMKMLQPNAVFAGGGEVPGEPQHPGNDYRNDRVPALLSKGEIVLPNTVTQSDDAPLKAAEFVKHLMEGGEPKDFQSVVSKKKSLRERIEHLEKLACGGYVGGKKK